MPPGPQARIVGGTPTTATWPAQAHLQTPLGSCGATLVSGRRVLTSAHCVTDLAGNALAASSLSVILGRTELAGAGPGDRYGVVPGGVKRHPGFELVNRGMTNDLAVLALDRAAPLEPMALITPSQTPLWTPGTIATVLGWGTTCSQTCSTVTQLRQADPGADIGLSASATHPIGLKPRPRPAHACDELHPHDPADAARPRGAEAADSRQARAAHQRRRRRTHDRALDLLLR